MMHQPAIGQHDILELMDRLKPMIEIEHRGDFVELGEWTIMFGLLLDQYLLAKAQAYAAIRARDRPGEDAIVSGSRRKTMALGAAYRFHLAEWKADAIRQDWPGYISASLSLLGRLEALISNDTERLHPLLADLEKAQAHVDRESELKVAIVLAIRALDKAGRATARKPHAVCGKETLQAVRH